MNNSELFTLIEYINNVPIGNTFVRNEIVSISKLDKNNSVDNYRLWLEHCGYLEKSGRGVYKVLKYIEPNLTVSLLKKMAYNPEYRINLDRFKKLNNILDEGNNL